MLQHPSIIEVAFHLLIGTSIATLIGSVAARHCHSASGQAFVWKAVTLGILCLLICEASGTSEGLGRLLGMGVGPDKTEAALEPMPRDSERSESVADRPQLSQQSQIPEISPPSFNDLVSIGLTHFGAPAEFDSLNEQQPEGIAPTNWVAEASAKESQIVGRLASWFPIWAGTLWLVGILVCLVPALGSGIYVLRLRRSLSASDVESMQRLARVRSRLNIKKVVHLFVHQNVATPIAIGTLRPTIVVPVGFSKEFTPEQQNAVFAHELSHLASLDAIWQQLSMLAVACVWWCPVVWYARKQLKSAMELAADEAVLCMPEGPRHLADCLVKVGRMLAAKPHYGLLSMTGASSSSGLALRVRRLLKMADLTQRVTRPRFMVRTGILCLFLFSSVLPGVIARAEQPFKNGETGMQLLKQSWQKSLVAGFAATLIAPNVATAQELDVNVDEDVRITRDVEVDIERGERRRIERAREYLEGVQRPRQVRRFAQNREETRRKALGEERKAREVEIRYREGQREKSARTHHIRQAINNLRAAGLDEHAERLERELKSDSSDLRIVERRQNNTTGMAQARSQSDPRHNPEMISVRREMAELREQLHHMRRQMDGMREIREMLHKLVMTNRADDDVRRLRRLERVIDERRSREEEEHESDFDHHEHDHDDRKHHHEHDDHDHDHNEDHEDHGDDLDEQGLG